MPSHDATGEPNCRHNDTYHEVLHGSRSCSTDTPITHSHCHIPHFPLLQKKKKDRFRLRDCSELSWELLWQNSCSLILPTHSSEGHTSSYSLFLHWKDVIYISTALCTMRLYRGKLLNCWMRRKGKSKKKNTFRQYLKTHTHPDLLCWINFWHCGCLVQHTVKPILFHLYFIQRKEADLNEPT